MSSAAAVIGAQRLAPAVPLLQPLALSGNTRQAVARDDGLLAATRSAAAAASGLDKQPLARLQRVPAPYPAGHRRRRPAPSISSCPSSRR